MNKSQIFAPLEIPGKLRLRNRLVMAPMTTTAGETDGRFSLQEIAYLEQRAGDGIGMIITPACYCHKSGYAFERQVGCHTDEMIPRLKTCAEAINRHGAASFLQIHHGGNAARERYTGHPPWAPSAVRNRRGTSEMPQAITEQQIQTVIEAFGQAARRAKEAGFTGIEIHGANTYLLQQFFSPYTNKRTDRWGAQTMENRCRFAMAVLTAVRAAVGPDYPVSYRLSPEEEEPDGYSVYDAVELLKHLVPLGVDLIHVSSWQYGTALRPDCPAGTHPTRLIKEAFPDIPVIGVGGLVFPEDVERVLEDGVELAALGKVLLLNADWVAKVTSGRAREIRTRASTREEIAQLDIPPLMKTYCEKFFLPGK
ncbi:MAG: NADH-dependent flavin oxidoreductase [Candidatus Zixiibacteriota bacterium]|nr:MAG: NADH-dependent flavin oxidoreductase [candidate division Zixibacteria bacterium]